MTLDEVKKKIPGDTHNFARFSIDLEHNGNFFSLTPMFGFAAVEAWWKENSEAYMITSVDATTKYNVAICINAVDE